MVILTVMNKNRRLLMVPQYSNYDRSGRFILEADSTWQMCINRIREMLKLMPELSVDIVTPLFDQVITKPQQVNPDLFEKYGRPDFANGVIYPRLQVFPMYIVPNALQSRYDFDMDSWKSLLCTQTYNYDTVYINDPMHLRNFKALFAMKMGYRPRFVVHSHFIDNPSAPKFMTEASLWMGQCEAARRADFNFWQSHSSMSVFFEEIEKEYHTSIVKDIKMKSCPYDDGYSIEEITSPVNYDSAKTQLLDSLKMFKSQGKTIVFVPNRIGREGVSSDYTRCGKFMFEVLPKLASLRSDYVIICGNPSQKIPNHQLMNECGSHGYVNMFHAAPSRDEYKIVASNADIVVAMYGGPNADTYGGTAMRECVELGCAPIMANCNEYKRLGDMVDWPYRCREDMSDTHIVLSKMIEDVKNNGNELAMKKRSFKAIVQELCSFEKTTLTIMKYLFND